MPANGFGLKNEDTYTGSPVLEESHSSCLPSVLSSPGKVFVNSPQIRIGLLNQRTLEDETSELSLRSFTPFNLLREKTLGNPAYRLFLQRYKFQSIAVVKTS